MEQVKDIVRLAVDEKERGLREQYDRVLATKLQGARRALERIDAGARNVPPPPLLLQAPIASACCSPLGAPPFAEQYMAFAKFNEDYISRSLKSKCALQLLLPPSLSCRDERDALTRRKHKTDRARVARPPAAATCNMSREAATGHARGSTRGTMGRCAHAGGASEPVVCGRADWRRFRRAHL